MAEINKLSVGEALDKMRRDDAATSKRARADEKSGELDKEIQRLRTANRRLERSQQAAATAAVVPSVKPGHVSKLKIPAIVIGAVVLIAVAMWSFKLL